MVAEATDTGLVIAGETISSRLFLGSSGYPNQKVMLDSFAAAACEIVTVSIRRISLEGYAESMVDLIGEKYRILPNTAGCETVRDAVLTAELAREALETNWVKLELIGDRDTLYPDVVQLIEAAEKLVEAGFVVLPYATDDPIVCRRLADVGCAAVMPLGSFIGSGQGIANPGNIELICRDSPVPVVLDAGIGTTSDAAIAMELGCDAVLANTAIAKAHDPVAMARAIRHGVDGGLLARRAGRIPRLTHAEPSSPRLGLIGA